MPAKSKAQRALFAMALAIRKGDMDKSEVDDEVMKIVNSDMTDKQLEDYAKTKGLKEQQNETYRMKTLKEYLNESLVSESHDEDVLRKLCDKLPEDAWNPWNVLQRAAEDERSPEDMAEEATVEANYMWDDETEERFRNLLDSPQYDKIVEAIRKLKSPYKNYLLALMEEFENML